MPLTHHRFTVDDYHKMVDAGILTEDHRVELLDGEIIEITPISPRHVACVIRLGDMLTRRGGDPVLVSTQNPVILSDLSLPEPDVVVIRRPDDVSGAWMPRHTDTLLVVEVAETSLHRDRTKKLPLYAQAGIPEVWIVNLPAERIEVYRDPTESGYATSTIVGHDGTLSPHKVPEISLRTDEVL
jgi:Uma2 family endonuclease